MRSHRHANTPRPSNAFDPEFLRRFDNDDDPPTAHEAAVAGLCRVRRLSDGRFGVFLSGASPERGHRPVAAFRERSRALMAAAMLAGAGRDHAFVLRKDAEVEGFAILAGLDGDGNPEVAGHMEVFDADYLDDLDAGDALMRSPEAMAYLLAAAGKTAVTRVGEILDALIAEGEEDGP